MPSKAASGIAGYKYYAGMHEVYAMSPDAWPIEEVSRFQVGEKTVWTGSITANGTMAVNAPDAFGGESSEGGVVGNIDVAFGRKVQAVNDYLAAKLTGFPVPAFRGVLALVLRQVYLAAMNPYLKPHAIFARRNHSAWYPGKSAIGVDINPAHLIYDALTNVQYALGASPGRVDSASFQAAADTLYSEGMGLSFFWQSDQQSIEDVIASIAQIAGGFVFQNQQTGLWQFKLARDDYTVSDLPIFDESNIKSVQDFSQPQPGDLASEVVLTFRDRETGKDQSVIYHDIAVLALQEGMPVRKTLNMPAIPTAELASLIVAREGRILATPLASAKLVVNRAAWQLNLGDVFRWRWSQYGIAEMVMRVTNIGRGKLKDGAMTVTCMQDIFGAGQAVYATPAPSGWSTPISAPSVSPNRRLIEAPYWTVIREVVGPSPTLQAEIDPLDGLLLACASRPTSDAYDFDLETRAGSADFADRGFGGFCPFATLAASVNQTDTVFSISGAIDLDLVAVGTWAEMDGEILKVAAIGSSTVTFARGILDTVPAAHASGAKIYFCDIHKRIDKTIWVSGTTVNAKLLTRTGAGVLAEGSAPTDSLVMAARYDKPYAPGKVTVNSVAYPSSASGDLTFAWAHRDRTQQTADLIEQSAGNIGPEAGVTYTLEIYNAQTGGSLIRTYSAIAGTSQAYAAAQATIDNGGTQPANLRAELKAVRGGVDSWQKQVMAFAWT